MTDAADTPEAPSEVWLEYADGVRFTFVPTIFRGYEDGCAVFEVVAPRDEPPVAAGMKKMPGKTSLVIPALRPKENP